jgi:rubrerythrin
MHASRVRPSSEYRGSPPVPREIATIEEFYAHALAIEREAVGRYLEFQGWYRDHGDAVLSNTCAELARAEEAHVRALAAKCAGLRLPELKPGEHRWLDAGAPEAPARSLFYRIVNPRQLLEIAAKAEGDAREFFDWVATTAGSVELRADAREMAREEAEHLDRVNAALARLPAPIDWSRTPAEDALPGALVGAEDEPPPRY